MRKQKMKIWEFYTLTIIAFLNLLIGFFNRNWVASIIGLGIALYLKPYLKEIPIPKAYRKHLNVDDKTTVEDLAKNVDLTKHR